MFSSYINPSTSAQDALGRVQVQTVYSFTNAALVPVYTNSYVYDGSDDGGYMVPKGMLYNVDSQGFDKAMQDRQN